MRSDRTQYHLQHSAGPGHWVIDEFDLSEALDAPYEARFSLIGDLADLDAESLLGADATLTIDREGTTHEVRGVIAQVERASSGVAGFAVRGVVRPAFALLARTSNCRIFQEKSVTEILEELLSEALSPYGRSLDVGTEAEYPKREYCVQYRESDFAFACRLMQEEGIAYHFDHAGEREVLVLTDANRAFTKKEGPQGAFGFVPDTSDAMNDDVVTFFAASSALGPTQVMLRDHDWTHPKALEASEGGTDAADRTRERYLHGHDVTFSDYSQSYQAHDHERQTKRERAVDATRELTIHGRSTILGLSPGDVIELSGHELPELDREYLVTGVAHRASSDHNRYQNAFACIASDVEWRPAGTLPKPRIPSVQSAVVVGPSGEEIHTDEHGRVKVQFHWDRVGQKDDHSSCWLRVGQPWAGASWGHVWLPRIGMEVIVDFVSGNPDRPRVIGCLYNNDNLPPYPLPDEKTKSTIKSNSTPGGGGFNELRFEDKAGSEEVFLHAQKDLLEEVLNDHDTDIGNNQENVVGVDQREDVGANQQMTVGANRTVHVKGAFDEKIDGGETRTVTAGSTETITGGEKRTVNGGLTERLSGGETRTINGSLTETITAAHTYTVNAASTENITGALVQTIRGGATITTPAHYDITALGGLNVIALAGSSIRTDGKHLTIASGGGNKMVDTWYKKIGKIINDIFSAKVAAIGLYSEETVVLRFRGGALKFEMWAFKTDVAAAHAEKKGLKLELNDKSARAFALMLHMGLTDIDP